MWQTIKDLQKEIVGFEARLVKAKKALYEIPRGFVEYEDYIKRKAKIKRLNSEIDAVRQMISYANEAIAQFESPLGPF